MYTACGTTINLVHYFEELLEDFAEKLEAENKELLEMLNEAKQTVSNSTRDKIESLIQKRKK